VAVDAGDVANKAMGYPEEGAVDIALGKVDMGTLVAESE